MTYSTLVEFELARTQKLVAKDHKQRWVTMNGHIHESPVPYRDAISVCWMPIVKALSVNYRDRILAHPAIGTTF